MVMAPWFFMRAPVRSLNASVTFAASSSVPNPAYGATLMAPPNMTE